MMNLGLDYNECFIEDVRRVSKADIQDMAHMLLSMPKLIAIIAPEEYIKEV